ncbi:MAG: DUF1553 domain-containing protein, partial [Deltaproteobacteria bacterium]|nr:DUF1553 domain-containing protein [Deltaproteobacteria bacterium]
IGAKRLGGGFRGRLDDLRLYDAVLSQNELETLAIHCPARSLVAAWPAKPTREDTGRSRKYFLTYAAPENYRESYAALDALGREKDQLLTEIPTTMVMADAVVTDIDRPRDTFMLVRGNYANRGEKVQAGVPAVLPPLPAGAPRNRLGLAKWLADPAHPLVARVTVNRYWQMYFGTGIVKTAEDFGVQGEWPSHPELLDWLATEFVRTGWNVKAMVRLMVTSATYRQSAAATPELTQRDPDNRLLAHGPRFRMPAEMVRDAALYEAGLLHEQLGGPSVKPYQPSGLWKDLIMQDMDYVQSKGPDLYRRSLYTFWKRTIAPPMMANFDSALRETCTVRENRTNTPLQALNLMNDVTFLEAARFIGQRMLQEGGASPDDRLRYGFRLVMARPPVTPELALLRNNLQYHKDYFASKAERVEAYLKQGDTVSDPALDRSELAAYAAVASLILNLDEAITKE